MDNQTKHVFIEGLPAIRRLDRSVKDIDEELNDMCDHFLRLQERVARLEGHVARLTHDNRILLRRIDALTVQCDAID